MQFIPSKLIVLFISVVAFLSDSKVPSNYHHDKPTCHSASWLQLEQVVSNTGPEKRLHCEILVLLQAVPFIALLWVTRAKPPGTAATAEGLGTKHPPCHGSSGSFIGCFCKFIVYLKRNCNKLFKFDVLLLLETALPSSCHVFSFEVLLFVVIILWFYICSVWMCYFTICKPFWVFLMEM